MALYNQYRPQTLTEVIGQDAIVTTMKNAFNSGRLLNTRSYLFHGTRGSGKTSTARILARLINCENPQNADPCNTCSSCLSILDNSAIDVEELDAASNRGVDDVERMLTSTAFTPMNLKRKVYILDEVHQLSSTAKDALLKTLEEPPQHVMFVLCTTELESIPLTVKSRCQTWEFKEASVPDISTLVVRVLDAEKVPYDTTGVTLVAKEAMGSYRDALSILEGIVHNAGAVTEATVGSMLRIPNRDMVKRAASALCKGDVFTTLEVVRTQEFMGANVEKFLDSVGRLIMDSARQLLLAHREEVYGLTPLAMMQVGLEVLKGKTEFVDSDEQIMGDVVLINAANYAADYVKCAA